MKLLDEKECLYINVENEPNQAETREQFLKNYSTDELEERGFKTAEEAFNADLDETVFEVLQVKQAENLKELCEILNSRHFPFDYSNIPTFGGEAVKNTLEVYSWDETHVLLQNYNGDFYLDKRCKCGEASFNCICED